MAYKKSLIAVLLVCVSAQSQATLNDSMNTMLSNITEGSSFTTNDRVGFQGGGVAIRSPISPINIIAFDPPRLSAGCGGLNWYGGSFSIINKDQFVALLRKIAQNSLGLAFKMAVDVVNSQLGRIMGEISDMINRMNSGLSNTCAISQSILNMTKSTASSMLDSHQATADGESAATGDADDNMSQQVTDSIKGLGQAISDSTSKAETTDSGNPIWKMISANQSGDQLFAGGVNIGVDSTINNEMIMSMSGFVIYSSSAYVQNQLSTSPDTGSDASTALKNQNEQLGRYHGRLLTIQDLRNGWYGNGPAVSGQDKKAIYICNPDVSPDTGLPDCTAFMLSTDAGGSSYTFPGILGFVNNALFGNPQGDLSLIGGLSATNVGGPVQKAGSALNAIDAMINGVKLTQAQSGVMMTTRLPVASLIYTASSGLQDRVAAFEEAKVLAPIIADEFTYAYVSAVVALMHQFVESIAKQKAVDKEVYRTIEYWEQERNALAESNKTITERIITANTFAQIIKSYNPALGFTVKSNK